MAVVALSEHVLCSTCLGEHKRKCGYFESQKRREEARDITLVPVLQDEPRRFCCNCGQCTWPEATYKLDQHSQVCDGVHEFGD